MFWKYFYDLTFVIKNEATALKYLLLNKPELEILEIRKLLVEYHLQLSEYIFFHL